MPVSPWGFFVMEAGMIALEELITEVMRRQPLPPAAIIVGKHDCERLKEQTYLTKSTFTLPSPAMAKICGVLVYEDPGLPPGNYEVITNEDTLRLRLHLIKLGVTVTRDGRDGSRTTNTANRKVGGRP